MESKVNLEGMNAKQLRQLREKIDTAIVEKQAEAKIELRERFKAMADEMALDVHDIIGAGAHRPRKAYSVTFRKFRDPKTGVTWAGRGRMPMNFDRKRAVEL